MKKKMTMKSKSKKLILKKKPSVKTNPRGRYA